MLNETVVRYTADEKHPLDSIQPVFAGLINQVGRIIVISHKIWMTIVGDAKAIAQVDPVSRYEDVLRGKLGKVFGVDLCTDGYSDPELQFLSGNEFVILESWDEYYRLVPIIPDTIDTTTAAYKRYGGPLKKQLKEINKRAKEDGDGSNSPS
jgi:hypothetical protein